MNSSERWERLEELVEALGDADTLEEIIQVIRISARGIVGADGITIVKREGDMVHYVAEDAVSPLWTGQRFPITACISGLAMLMREPIVIPDVFADPRVPHAAYEPTFVKSMAMFPVGLDDPVMAVGAYWARAGEIDAETIELMRTATRSMGTPIAALYGQRTASQPAPLSRPSAG